MSTQNELTALHTKLGHKALNRTWTKLEIFLGLSAVSAGLWMGAGLLTSVVFVLGSYLALGPGSTQGNKNGRQRPSD